jgi:predicted nucleic acid-binding protein
MEQGYLIDSNAAIDFLAGKYELPGQSFMNKIVNDIPVLSIISKIEILGFTCPENVYSILESFIGESVVIPLTDAIVEKTIEIRKKTKVKLPDAIIAATCLSSNLILISRNINDFKNIPNLVIFDPHTI